MIRRQTPPPCLYDISQRLTDDLPASSIRPASRCSFWRHLALTALSIGISAGAWAQADWKSVGGDPGVRRYSELAQITRENVAGLRPEWTFRTGGLGFTPTSSIQCTPIIVNGTMYLTSPDTQVIALDAATGVEKWRYNPQRTTLRYLYNRGVAWWSDGGANRRIIFATPDGFMYSVEADTGSLDPKFGAGGIVDLRAGLERDIGNRVYGATAAPVVIGDRVIVGVSLDEGYEGGPGDVRAFDVRSGKEVWRFHTVPRPGEFGHETWAGESWKNRTGVNAWSGASFDVARGLVFVGTGSPGYDFYGGDRRATTCSRTVSSRWMPAPAPGSGTNSWCITICGITIYRTHPFS